MDNFLFIDTEVSADGKIKDIGAVKDKDSIFHSNDTAKLTKFAEKCNYVVGHNIILHDSKYISKYLWKKGYKFIDTLYLSPLLFPQKPYHKLVKDDKLQIEELNNPVNDCKKCQELFYEEIASYDSLPIELKNIYANLLHQTKEFSGFFEYVNWKKIKDLNLYIMNYFKDKFCESKGWVIYEYITKSPIGLAYALALIYVNDEHSLTPPWVYKNYPIVEKITHLLRGKSCKKCNYCKSKFDSKVRLKEIFGYDSFRTYDGDELQEKAVNAAIDGKSLLAIFPTGGGKSLTFQLPALIIGEAEKALTVVISPLQSLMKDQVDNLVDRGLIDAVTINGMLNEVERKQAIESLYDGKANLLYIAPESLRSKTVEKILLSRSISRFVIDEAHCFSSWGQDFRVDYLYIADFIKDICKKKNLKENEIPISCFTATAKQKVISDISDYFYNNLGIRLEKYTTTAIRKNLHYKVLPKKDDDDKYQTLRDLLEQYKDIPTIIYVSTTTKVENIAGKLNKDGFKANYFHGKMENEDKKKSQDAFKSNDVKIMVATSAFGMGVDKSDVGLVIHYDIANSLENYVQEAGRAGRDENINADCYILFCEEDLDKHFMLLNQTKVNMNEIQQIWSAIKNLTKNKDSLSISALELARNAGWDDSIENIEIRVRTAISALENAKYVERGKNSPRVFANGILAKSVIEARKMIENSPVFEKEEIEDAVRIITSLISSKSKNNNLDEDAESRIDYISDRLGINKYRVIKLVNLLREANILADSFDMNAKINKSDSSTRSSNILELFLKIEKFLIDKLIKNNKSIINLKELNDEAIKSDIRKCSVKNIKTILSYWMTKNYINKTLINNSNDFKIEPLLTADEFTRKYENRLDIANFIISYLYSKTSSNGENETIEFSILELIKKYQNNDLFSRQTEAKQNDIEDSLLYLSRIKALDLDGGFLVIYNALQIKRLVLENNRKYKKEDYKQLSEFYDMKIQQIHIVGEYANMMVNDYESAITFVSDYFNLEYDGFIKKYFKGNRKGEIQKNITPQKYNKLFGELSPIQKNIIDSDNQYITVLAGPGSGKTRVLVHKLASLLLLEDIKTEQLLMLTFSRAAATEFKSRLKKLIENTVFRVDIKTFHSYCFDLLGKLADETEFGEVVEMATEMINNGEVETNKITKAVLVIDEAQDISDKEYALIKAIINRNEDIRVIIVGDDDQNIYDFRNKENEIKISNSMHMMDFTNEYEAKTYEMIENYRSVNKIVNFANAYVKCIKDRFKKTPIACVRKDLGRVELIKHEGAHFEEALVKHVIENIDKRGTIAVLTTTNKEALVILGLLLKNDIKAKLIQSLDKVKIYNLIEIRYFIKQINNSSDSPIVTENEWYEAQLKLKERYKDSINLELALDVINTFKENYKLYKSDFVEYTKQSDFADFVREDSAKVIVSTIHKAKGKEFDHVYMYLNNFKLSDNEKKRDLYVGFTRAKNNLYIHINNNILDKYKNHVDYINDYNVYDEPEYLCVQLNYRNVYLGSFKSHKKEIAEFHAGLSIDLDEYGMTYNNKKYFSFSKEFKETIDEIISSNYEFDYGIMKNVVVWKDIEEDIEYPIILPELHFKKNHEIESKSINTKLKDEANSMLASILNVYQKYPNFRFSYFSLVNFLSGEEDNVINAFRLYEEEGYGIFALKKSYYAKRMISSFKKMGILLESKNDKGYSKFDLMVEIIDDEQLLLLEQLMKQN